MLVLDGVRLSLIHGIAGMKGIHAGGGGRDKRCFDRLVYLLLCERSERTPIMQCIVELPIMCTIHFSTETTQNLRMRQITGQFIKSLNAIYFWSKQYKMKECTKLEKHEMRSSAV